MKPNVAKIETPHVLSPAVRIYSNGSEYALFHTLLLNVVYLDDEAFHILLQAEFKEDAVAADIRRRLKPAGFFRTSDCTERQLVSDFLSSQQMRGEEEQEKLRPNFVRLVVTERCNLHCDYCFVSKSSKGQRNPDPSVGELVDELTKLVRMNSARDLCIQYFGGEPLLRLEEISQISLQIKSAAAQYHVQLTETMVSNGLLVNAAVLERIRHLNIALSLSLDGCDIASVVPRYGRQAAQHLNKIRSALKLMQEYGMPANVNLTPSKHNTKQLIKIVEELGVDWGVDCIFVNTPVGWSYSADDVLPDQLASQLFLATSAADRIGVRFISIADRFLRGLDEHAPQIEDCIAPDGGVSLALFGEGKWSLCDMNWHHGDFIVNQSPVPGDTSLANMKWKKLLPFDGCWSCDAKMLCGGPCPNEFAILAPDEHNYRCRFFEAALPIAVFHRRYV